MLITALMVLTTLVPRIEAGAERLAAQAVLPPPAPVEAARYEAAARAVTNWRSETGEALLPASLALVARLSASDPAFVARCVKLNNYWCIKRARWPGEIGGDAEGHTGFASAADGADAAANLLRRYYRTYGRRTALAIVRRWAPAECGPAPAVRVPATPAPATAPVASVAATAPAAAAAGLTTRGLGQTLRARYLARHLRGGAPRRVAAARRPAPASRVAARPALRVQPWSPLARMAGHPGLRPGSAAKPARAIAASPTPVRGADNPAALLERRTPPPSQLVAESATLPLLAPGFTLSDLRAPAPICSGDTARIGNYAAAIAGSVGLGPDDDLKLFDAEGRPGPNLERVMLAMSKVELGTMRASAELVRAAIARLSIPALATAQAAN
ncbi:hypothetical protein BHAOGJBA_0309 [Methylobacterium hispanicum]|uniref:Lytic transglycosylase n=1 Tax=Methylobacterium hispanicum TaxID=270350 RepID=A0AAV4ZET4_9HYPH|nr:hypothetical protein [Methylobacterium hispanicum]GJD86813.1 hypothetical protein BHAOGJBA_0309 [Methylobacterium hispanicum]